jgi:4-amino-4-deoxy-L-arabinose transferase-like glycosyltransferase
MRTFLNLKNWRTLAIGFVLIGLLALIWLRTGIYPAASTGDDTWFSEPAYYLLHEGTLRSPWMADDRGSAERYFFPPVPAIIQAAAFALFGINSFGEMAQSSLVCTLLSLLVVCLARRNGASGPIALAAGIAIFGLQIVLQDSIRPRYEPWMATFLMLSLLLREWAQGLGRRGWLIALFAGLSLGISCLSYYPYAPSALLAGLLPIPLKRAEWLRYLAVILGGSIMLVLFLLFIGSDWDLFARQMLGTGGYYFSWQNLLTPFRTLLSPSDPITWLMTGEALCLIFVSAILAIVNSAGAARRFALQAIIMAAPFFVLGHPASLVAAGVLLILALAVCTKGSPQSSVLKTASVIAVVGAAIFGTLKIGFIVTVAWLQREGRDYSMVRTQLDRLVTEPGRVAADQPAWLALRPRLGPDQLHWLIDSGSPQTYLFRSMILREANAGAKFKYLVIVKGQLQSILRDYPGFRDDIATGRFHEIGQIHLPFRNLPIAPSSPYDLVVYGRGE